MTIVLSAFEAFNKRSVNVSEQLLKALKKGHKRLKAPTKVTFKTLKVDYRSVDPTVAKILKKTKPALWIAFGESGRGNCLRIESRAKNLDSCTTRDNRGVLRKNEKIEATGPRFIRSSVDLKKLKATLRAQGAPFEMSRDAGAFLCNHLYYRVLSAKIPCVFIHVPKKLKMDQAFVTKLASSLFSRRFQYDCLYRE